MERKEIIKTVILDNQKDRQRALFERTLTLPLDTGKIITIIGARRSGKTYLLYQLRQRIIHEKKRKPEQLIYLNFEDERLDLSINELDLILQACRELFPGQDLADCYFLFDEIQNINDWEKFIRRLYDQISTNIYLTGSNARLLSSEIATSLRGRTLSFELLPLSFKEFLHFQKITPDKYSSEGKSILINQVRRYLQNGGFPETLFLDENLSVKTLQEYFNIMIYRDLVERYKITQAGLLKYFIKRLYTNLSKPTSINKIFHELKANGYKVGKNTLYQFLDWVEATHMIMICNRYDPSIVKQESSERKLYIIDNGLVNAVSFNYKNDWGKLLENTVYLHLRREGKSTYFHKAKKECDFICYKEGRIETAIQVCYNLSDRDTRERELKGLHEACSYYSLSSGKIICLDQPHERLHYKGLEVEIVPAYDFLLP